MIDVKRTGFGIVLACLAATGTLGCKSAPETKSAASATPSGASEAEVITLKGMYSYMADAAVFQDCATGVKSPVATEGDNIALERAYGASGTNPGAPILVTLDGRLELRPWIDHPGQQQLTVIVEQFDRVWPGETCGSITTAPLEGAVWGLLELDGRTIELVSSPEAPYLELNGAKKSAYGFGGCNRFFGTYALGKNQALAFSDLGTTRMACPEGMDQEQALLGALGATNRYEIHGSKLLLYAGDVVVARFQARNLLKTD